MYKRLIFLLFSSFLFSLPVTAQISSLPPGGVVNLLDKFPIDQIQNNVYVTVQVPFSAVLTGVLSNLPKVPLGTVQGNDSFSSNIPLIPGPLPIIPWEPKILQNAGCDTNNQHVLLFSDCNATVNA